MDTMLFTSRSLWTMVHGILLGGLAIMASFAALWALWAMRADDGAGGPVATRATRHLVGLLLLVAVSTWLTVLVGAYVSFPDYRVPPPEGATDLARYPRALLMSSPGTRWLHSFAMEVKEHMPWIAAMVATAVAFVGVRYRGRLLADASLRRPAWALLAACFAIVAFVSLLGVFINKVAPLE